MGLVYTNGKMDQFMKVNSKKAANMEEEYMSMQEVLDLKEPGKTVKEMAKVFSLCLIRAQSLGTGRMMSQPKTWIDFPQFDLLCCYNLWRFE